MTYVDRRLGNNDVWFQAHFPRVRSWTAQAQDWGMSSFSALSSFLAYLATERGPTSSASMLIYGGLAAAGAALYDSWSGDLADPERPGGRFCERGCLRRLTSDLQIKAADEVRLHQEMFGRSFGQYYGLSSRDDLRLRFWR
jgi:hypothetical protein